jgi:hypothetical protein
MLGVMRARVGSVRAAGLALGVLLALGACGIGWAEPASDPDESDTVTATDLGDLDDSGSILDALEPHERDAFAQSGMSGAREPAAEHAAVDEAPKSLTDKIGDAAMSVLVVAVSIGAAVAPYLLF